MNAKQQHSVIILCGPTLRHRHTCATLIEAGVHVVGICVCNQKSIGLRIKYVLKSIEKKGLGKTLGQILGRLYYSCLNKSKDRAIFRRLYDEEKTDRIMHQWKGKFHYTNNYTNPKTLKWLEDLHADIYVAHTPYWIGKKVRELPRKKIILGGHPGLTPKYRGSHSAFWAISNGCPKDVGCSVFWLDKGVDTGDLIRQESIEIEEGDSFITLGWKGMIQQARMLTKTLLEYDAGIDIPRRKHDSIPENSCYDLPTLHEYLDYRRKQNKVR